MHLNSRLSSLVKTHQHLPFVREVELTRLVDEHADLGETVCLFTQKVLSQESDKKSTLSVLQEMMWSILVILWNKKLLTNSSSVCAASVESQKTDRTELSRLTCELLIKEKQLKRALDMLAKKEAVYTPEVTSRDPSPIVLSLVENCSSTNCSLFVDNSSQYESVSFSSVSTFTEISTSESSVETESLPSQSSRGFQTSLVWPKFEAKASVPPLLESVDHWTMESFTGQDNEDAIVDSTDIVEFIESNTQTITPRVAVLQRVTLQHLVTERRNEQTIEIFKNIETTRNLQVSVSSQVDETVAIANTRISAVVSWPAKGVGSVDPIATELANPVMSLLAEDSGILEAPLELLPAESIQADSVDAQLMSLPVQSIRAVEAQSIPLPVESIQADPVEAQSIPWPVDSIQADPVEAHSTPMPVDSTNANHTISDAPFKPLPAGADSIETQIVPVTVPTDSPIIATPLMPFLTQSINDDPPTDASRTIPFFVDSFKTTVSIRPLPMDSVSSASAQPVEDSIQSPCPVESFATRSRIPTPVVWPATTIDAADRPPIPHNDSPPRRLTMTTYGGSSISRIYSAKKFCEVLSRGSVFERLYRDAFERLLRHEAAAAEARKSETEAYLAKHSLGDIWEIDTI